MRFREFQTLIPEYETGTPRSSKIEQVMRQAGYGFLGGGAEATVWSHPRLPRVIKIIMPDDWRGDNRVAMATFQRFLKLTQSYPSPHWPRFHEMQDEHGRSSVFAKFRVGDRQYMQIAMERLEPLTADEQEIIEIMSEDVAQGRSVEHFTGWGDDSNKWIDENRWQLPSLWKAMRAAHRKTNWDYDWDLHGGNVMRRQDGTYVIIDPWIRWK